LRDAGTAAHSLQVVGFFHDLLKLLEINAEMATEAPILGNDHHQRQQRTGTLERQINTLHPLARGLAPQHQGRNRIEEAIEDCQQVGRKKNRDDKGKRGAQQARAPVEALRFMSLGHESGDYLIAPRSSGGAAALTGRRRVGHSQQMPTSAASAKTGADGVFTSQLAVLAGEIEALLARLLRPPRLLEAMRYAALGGGKRLRPFLLVETARLFDVGPAAALPAAAAIECIHTYSLIHDDLPAMDNDALRRGRPTLHMAFDEATAILAGDALLTLAFDLLARVETHPDAAVRVRLIAELGCAAGAAGMVGGQLLDLAAEGRFATAPRPGEADIARIDSLKTGALLRAACRMGAIIGNAPPDAGTAIDR